ncbi:MAG: hypothetical protein UU87_C0001G0073 [Parcubacteria group bacterium GW2011_GWA2_42_11]|nr:MAG: hypothetical protein UU87_C0001G0073 [Parcubacteria group bacterium GW2011_GWA2_42_11]
MNNNFKKLILKLAVFFKKNYYIFFSLLMIFCLLAASWLFYRFVWNPSAPADNQAGYIKVDQSLYDRIIGRLEKKQVRLQEGLQDNFMDIFK